MTDLATTPAIERSLDLHAAPDRVWRALTDASELAAWFGQRCDLAPVVGYDGWMEWDGHGRYAMRVVEAVPLRRFAIRWMNEPGVPLDADRSTLVEWDLEPTPSGGTRLHLRESGLRSMDGRHGNVVGWLSETAELVAHLASRPWEAGIRRTYRLRAPVERVWRAFADPAEFSTWWGGSHPVELRAGALGWWDWPHEGGRFAVRVDVVEPPVYLAWTWTTVAETSLDAAPERLHTQWALEARDDGGTDLHLFESGFLGPENHDLNDRGWDGAVIPALRRQLAEDSTST